VPEWIAARFVIAAFGAALAAGAASAAPTSVTIFGGLQTELGCGGDFDVTCPSTAMTYSASSDIWRFSGNLPAGNYTYYAALDNDLGQLYGANASPGGGSPIGLSLAQATAVNFYYDDKTHWITDNVNSVIAGAFGDFQSELGCPGDFDPTCLRSWLQDVDGDGTYRFQTAGLPAGNYNALVALNESLGEIYGAGGVPPQNGQPAPNIPFTVPETGTPVLFLYDPNSHILTVQVQTTPPGTAVPEPGSLALFLTGVLGLIAWRLAMRPDEVPAATRSKNADALALRRQQAGM